MHHSRLHAIAFVVALTLTTTGPAHAALQLGPTEPVDTTADGVPADLPSAGPHVSADGRFVAFWSEATNLVPDDTNGTMDVFVKDTVDGTVQRVSVDDEGREFAGDGISGSDVGRSYPTSISADGRYVLFGNTERISPDQTVGRLWLGDRTAGTSRLLEVRDRSGVPARWGWGLPRLSGNGRYVALTTGARLVRRDRDKHSDVYRLDLTTDEVRLVTGTPLDATDRPGAAAASISHSGRVIAFSTDERMVRRDHTEWAPDVYVRDLRQRRPRLVSQSSSGVQANRSSEQPFVSANGRYVLFATRATNLVRRDTNRKQDVFVRDLRRGTTHRVSVNSRERQGNEHSGESEYATISNDGRFVVFTSRATNLAPGTTDFLDADDGGANVFVRDRQAGTTTAVTMAPDGTGADGPSGCARISRDGSVVVFCTDASNLAEGDKGGGVLLRRLGTTAH